MRKLCWGTPGGQKIGKNLQMKLPPKKEKANIWKYGKSFLCIFTFVNMDFCTFLHTLWCEWNSASNTVPPSNLFVLISFQFFAYVYILTWKRSFLLQWSTVKCLSLGGHYWVVILSLLSLDTLHSVPQSPLIILFAGIKSLV